MRTHDGAETGAFMRDVRCRGETALHRAAADADATIIEALIEAGADRTGPVGTCARHGFSTCWPSRRTESTHTLEQLDGPRYPADRPLLVLLGARSQSAAEAFAYALKTLGRALVVGEPSGGVQPGDPVRLSDHFDVVVPNGRSTSPITQSNWKGVGVTPDIATAADAALAVAQQRLLHCFLAQVANDAKRQRLSQRVAALQDEVAAP